MSGFGLAHIKMEGAAWHPDETECDVSDAWYIKQGASYIRDTGDESTYFVRDELKPQIFAALAEMRGTK